MLHSKTSNYSVPIRAFLFFLLVFLVTFPLSSSAKNIEHSNAYPVNASGETYGADIYSSLEEPDLIEAYGTNGDLGYIRLSDIDRGPPSNPDEAIKYNASRKDGRTIPLYTQDGITIIGEFDISSFS